jgi:hypothetical protein
MGRPEAIIFGGCLATYNRWRYKSPRYVDQKRPSRRL